MQPLSQEARALYKKQRLALDKANKGLLFERFYDGYENDFSLEQGSHAAELNSLGIIGRCGSESELKEAAKRRVNLVSELGGQFGVFATDWHFVSGMGNAHPVENGFTWHPVYGTPYLPGSSVKGLLRAWMEHWANAEQDKEQRQQLVHDWFGRSAGTGGKSDAGKAGDLIFFDAIPVERPAVSVDIMTPHMGKWYEQGGEKITAESQPGDWHSPVPVPFLVTADARFVFSVAPRTPKAQVDGLAEQAMEHLKDALAWLGAGAKTAAGYGHMSFDERDTLLRFKSDEERARIRLAEAGIAMGVETWTQALVSSTNPGAGELTVKRTDENGVEEFATGKFFGQLSKKAKERAKKKKVYVDVDIERQGNQIMILAIREA